EVEAMKLAASCQCGKVKFRFDSEAPYPFMFCYCSICRKLAGGPIGVNIIGNRKTRKVTGSRYIRNYHAKMGRKRSSAERAFCTECGAHLWLQDDEWPDWFWPNAGVVDTPLPVPPSRVHIFVKNAPKWMPKLPGPRYTGYPDFSIVEWHERHGLRKKR